MQIVPKNWAQYQHYKNRNPPWIKVHHNLLDDRTFTELPIQSKALAPMLWLLASERKDGIINASTPELCFRLRMKQSDVEVGLKSLMSAGLFIQTGEPVDVVCDEDSDAHISTEDVERKKIKPPRPQKNSTSTEKPDGVSDQVWTDFLILRQKKGAILTPTAMAGIVKQAAMAGMTLDQALSECCERDWRGFKAAWMIDKRNGTSAKVSDPLKPWTHEDFAKKDYGEGIRPISERPRIGPKVSDEEKERLGEIGKDMAAKYREKVKQEEDERRARFLAKNL